MLIISQDASKGTNYDTRRTIVTTNNDNDDHCLYINSELYAKSKSKDLIHLLWLRLMHYKENYRRQDDTFDISRELKVLQKQVDKGSFNNIDIYNDSIALEKVGYPTYTS